MAQQCIQWVVNHALAQRCPPPFQQDWPSLYTTIQCPLQFTNAYILYWSDRIQGFQIVTGQIVISSFTTVQKVHSVTCQTVLKASHTSALRYCRGSLSQLTFQLLILPVGSCIVNFNWLRHKCYPIIIRQSVKWWCLASIAINGHSSNITLFVLKSDVNF